ncbi:hypothetical protein HHI36_015601 [Cryptolaemus montrouzieri]|uniref:Uncharacterized protein n=1 Tax=Cryptolaemus montrouzieri TaxID=559131 RepID=A0ABD2N6M3_9CUCU
MEITNHEIQDNPCCNKKGTLIITIEPCTKGRAPIKEHKSSFSIDKYYEKFIPGLPRKTPRTMEIEIKIKGKDQPLFSDEDIPVQEESEVQVVLPAEKVEEIEYVDEEEADNIEEHCKKSMSRIILLQRNPCSKTCPGPLICLPKRQHFMGDNCKLHDPTAIGNQILEMHKTGGFKKPLVNIDRRIYPDHILMAVCEIEKKRRQAKIRKSSLKSVESKTIWKTQSASIFAPSEDMISDIGNKETQTTDDQFGGNKSGCFCR